MRIECENCSAAYTIGDALLSDQPIGAQCPYCGHVRVVRRGDPPSLKSGDLQGPRSEPPSFGRGSAPPSFPPAGAFGSLPPGGFGPGALVSAPPPPSLTSSGSSTGAFGSSALNSSLDLDLGNLGTGLGPAPGFGAPGPGPAPSSARGGRFGPSEPAPGGPELREPAPQASGATCQVCGTELVDEFDKVIGLCEIHQRERSAQEFGASSAEVREWRVRQADGNVAGPFTLAEVRNALSTGEVSPDDQFAKQDFNFGPIDRHPELRIYAKRGAGGAAAKGEGKQRAAVAPMRRGGSGVSVGTVFLGLVLLALVGGGAYVVMNPSVAEGFLARFSIDSKRIGTLPPNPLKRQLDQWRLAHPDVSGTPDEHLVSAKARHLEDTWRGYQLAQDALQRALILDEDNPRAIAAYVENLSIWRGPLLTEEELRISEAAIRFALAVAPEDAAVQRGRAALSWVRGDLNACRAAAERAVTLDASDAQARLLLAGSFLEGNVPLAIREAEQAASRMPQLRRSDRVLARAYANAGRYASAIKTLDKRLEADGSNGAVHWLRGDIERELGELDAAKKHYRQAVAAEGDRDGARLALGELLIEQRDPRAAVEAYRQVVEDEKVPIAYKVTALSALARAEADLGRPARARDYAAAARKLQPRELPVALLVMAEGALDTGSATTAQTFAQRALTEREGEPALLVVMARAAVALRRSEEAVRRAEEAVQNDPKDARLRGILAGIYLAAGANDRAFTVMRQAGELDPLERDARHRKGLLSLGEKAQREAIARFREASKELRDRSVANSSAAMLHYHLGETGRAQELIDQALAADDSNTAALIYAAQLSIDRGNQRQAEKLARKALRIDRGSPIALLLLGRALAMAGDEDGAMEAFDSALRSAPGLLIAQVERASLLLAEGQRDQAIELLAHAHRVNPHLLRTRRLLLQAGY